MKPVRIIIACLIISVIGMANTCYKQTDDYHSYYLLKNKTNAAVYSAWNFDSSLLTQDYPPAVSPAEKKCEANSEKKFGYHHSGFEYYLTEPNSKVYIFVFDATVLENTNWDSVKKYNLFLKRYDFTRTQMDSANWTISFR